MKVLSEVDRAQVAELLERLQELRTYDKLGEYTDGGLTPPTPKQREFHNAGATHRIRMLAAGNQTGKTFSAGMEVAAHLTGRYPDWWEGHRFDHPVKCWASGVTSESTRDNPQRILLGENRDWGSGTVPRDALVDSPVMARGTPESVDQFRVHHVSGGVSSCAFKSYEKGREKWQGETLHLVWGDEEMPYTIYQEALTRLNRHQGHFLITFTPLMGMTEVCRLFFEPQETDTGQDERCLIQMTLRDAHFYKSGEMDKIEAQYPEHERRARTQGLPVLGEGLVYPFPQEALAIPAFPIPAYFRRIIGLDFGFNHPTAACALAWDPESDLIIVYDIYEDKANTIAPHAAALRKMNADKILVAWPHDGHKTDPMTGTEYHDLYRSQGLRMHYESARYDDDKGGGQAVGPIIQAIKDRMAIGKLKVFSHLSHFFHRQTNYYFKDGVPVTYNDDLMKALSYGVMMIRHAEPWDNTPRFTSTDSSYNPFALDIPE